MLDKKKKKKKDCVGLVWFFCTRNIILTTIGRHWLFHKMPSVCVLHIEVLTFC